jgi:ATP phosphoribosyltransferase regulatory subunit HisZ
MKVRALTIFNDLQSNKLRYAGEIFEASEKRVEQINSTQYGALVEVIEDKKDEEVKKSTNKKPIKK